MGRHGFEGAQSHAMQSHQVFASHAAAEAYTPQVTQQNYYSHMQSSSNQTTQRYNTYSSSGYGQWSNAQYGQSNNANQWRGHAHNSFSLNINIGNGWNNYGPAYDYGTSYMPQWGDSGYGGAVAPWNYSPMSQWDNNYAGGAPNYYSQFSGVPQWNGSQFNNYSGIPQWGNDASSMPYLPQDFNSSYLPQQFNGRVPWQVPQWAQQWGNPMQSPWITNPQAALDQLGNYGTGNWNGGWDPRWDAEINSWSGGVEQPPVNNQVWNQYEMSGPNQVDPHWSQLSMTIQGMIGHSVREYDSSIDPNLGCALFVSTALRRGAGVQTRAESTAQLRQDLLKAGYHPTTHPQPGDPIIAERAPGLPGHAAIYIGDGKIAANSSAHKVIQITSVDTFKRPDYMRVVAYHRDSNPQSA
ncbi:MAG TPA: hypothetical protein V6C81_00050 [Planktothrix sp.]